MVTKRNTTLDTPEDLALAAMSPAFGKQHTPIQIQKLLFLISQQTPHVAGQHFVFKPRDYGPFAPEVYRTLERLEDEGLVIVQPSRSASNRRYSLTPEGQRRAEQIFASLDTRVSSYFREVSEFVRGLSFAELVVSIYKAYPEMKVNSIFKEASS